MSGEEGKSGWGGGTTRRTILKTAAGAGAVAGAGVGGILLTTSDEPVLAASGVTAGDVGIANNDGSVSKVTINPELTVEWENLEEPAEYVRVRYYAMLSGDNQEFRGDTSKYVAFQGDTSMSAKSGTATIPQFDPPKDILAETDLSSSDFEDTTDDGIAETTDVDLGFVTSVLNDDTEAIIERTDTVTFTVSVNNREATVSVSGSANTGGE